MAAGRTRTGDAPSPVPAAPSLPSGAYRRLFERSPEPHFVERLDGTIVDVNEAAARLHGWTREDLIGQSYEVTVADEPRGIGGDAISELLERGSFRRQTTALRRDGSRFPAEVVAVRLATPAGDFALIHVADLSNRAALETAAYQLGELGRLGDRPLSPEEVAERATAILVDSFGAAAGSLVTFEGDAIHWRARVGTTPGPERLAGLVVPSENSRLRSLLGSQRAAAFDIAHVENAAFREILLSAGVTHVWILPVLSGDDHQGFISLQFAESPPPEAFDAPRLGAIGRVVGTALHNAYLRDEMRGELERRTLLEESARLADVVVRQAHDPVIVTDPGVVIRSWNPAAEGAYGIDASEAVGHRFREIVDTSEPDGAPLDPGALERVLSRGAWRSRVLQRPRIGRRAGEEIIVDSVVTALRDEGGSATGLVAVNRDVTATARLEAELATLGSLAIETGEARSRTEVADAALAVLRRATAAEAGLILAFDGPSFEVIGRAGLSAETVRVIRSYRRLGDRLNVALRGPTAVVVTPIRDSPIRGEIAAAIEADGIASVMFVGLRVGGQLEGLLGLGWRETPATRPSDEAVLQAAALVASGIANARLLESVERGYEQERRLTTRLETLIDLTRLPEVADDEHALAEDLLDRIVSTLAAAGGVVVRLADDRLDALAGPALPPGFESLRRERKPAEWGFVRRLAAGSPAYVAPISEESVGAASQRAGRAAGYAAYAAFPIRAGEELEAAVVVFFEQSVDTLPIDSRTLEAIGRIVQIAFTNQRLRRTAIASELRYRTLFEESPDALTLQDEGDRIVDVNRAAERMYGAPREQLVGRPVADFVVAEQRTDAEPGPEVWRAIGRRADASPFPQEVIVSRIEVDGQPRVLARVRDLTEQEQLQQELVQAQKMDAIGQLVSGVAHELNNPLAAIIAFSQLLRQDPLLPEALRRDADLLVGEADRTRRIVQNLLDFARQRPPERHPTPLRPLVQSILDLQTYSLGLHHIATDVEIDDSLPPIELDRAQMQQVLLNLVQNAIHAIRSTGQPGTIRIAARLEDHDARRVRVTVSDTGPGVAAEHRDRLFEPFFTTKAPGEGTGLGLPVSFGIVAAHGGQLTLEPDEPGATFAITLPVVAAAVPTGTSSGTGAASRAAERAAAERAAAGPPRPGPTGARRRVLVLDDEPSIRAFLRKALPPAGFDADVSGDGADAVARVREHEYAAVLCDYRMAGMSGTDVYEAAVSIRPSLARRFVFMSGDVLNPELATFAREHGVTLLAKPFDLETVQHVVSTVVDGDATDGGPG